MGCTIGCVRGVVALCSVTSPSWTAEHQLGQPSDGASPSTRVTSPSWTAEHQLGQMVRCAGLKRIRMWWRRAQEVGDTEVTENTEEEGAGAMREASTASLGPPSTSSANRLMA